MADRYLRAQINLAIISQRSQSALDAWQAQLKDTQDVCNTALQGGYTTGQALADVTALWVNGLAAVGAFYGFIPSGSSTDEPTT